LFVLPENICLETTFFKPNVSRAKDIIALNKIGSFLRASCHY
jgi:hypothetical protein